MCIDKYIDWLKKVERDSDSDSDSDMFIAYIKGNIH